ncbi:hypothetical protein [Paraflavitalea speifideaquila]|uniref:hypothetical protein n=1 Tax=Paraflavitalea speifideaquila TaxID=3076558 RepID=UPI0028F09486|nr:hypothetical protein [Paraflavitalea speifideiaquila]
MWNKGKGVAKPLDQLAKDLNTYLEKVRSKTTSIFQDMELKSELLTAKTVKLKYLSALHGLAFWVRAKTTSAAEV